MEDSLGAILQEMIERFKLRFASAGVVVTSEIEENLRARFDLIRMEQVFANLFENVLKYAPQTPLTVRAYRDGVNLRFEVKDNGPGVHENQTEKIFDRFERGSASINAGGLGLGLYIVQKIMQGHRGRIWVESTMGKGTTFIGLLPGVE